VVYVDAVTGITGSCVPGHNSPRGHYDEETWTAQENGVLSADDLKITRAHAGRRFRGCRFLHVIYLVNIDNPPQSQENRSVSGRCLRP
jgi:hypothetical protein